MVQYGDVRQPDERRLLPPSATRDPNRAPLSNSPIIDTYEPATAPPGGGDSCMDDRAPTCADFAHRIGEIGESAKVRGRFSPSVQELHMHTFCSAK